MSVSPVCRPALDGESPALVRIWRRAVEATHDFLTGDDIDGLEVQVRDVVLPALGLTVATLRDEPVGWIGMHGSHVEALFVDPSAHRRGVGRALLSAAAAFPLVTVDVNEQNPSAITFYEALGFVRAGRSALDGDGRPFPLVHLRRA
ncbi:MAG TPA: acetyltransferase [Pseudonocardia sp.]|jgi:putative acetyltransferase|nr:acetyltransferase [Pseudonocardia sp.]